MRVAAVLFDLDDTLLDAEAAWREGVSALIAARSPGVELDRGIAAWDQVFPEWFERFLTGEISLADSRSGRIRDWARLVGVAVVDGAEADWFADYVVGYERGWALFPDVRPTLAALTGLPIGIVTNGDGAQQRQKVAALGLAPSVHVVVVSADLGAPKPDPAIFHHAAALLGVDPDACVMVGDRLDRDVTGAVAAGMHAVWLRRPGGPDTGRDTPSDLVGRISAIETLAELPWLLGRGGAGGTTGLDGLDGTPGLDATTGLDGTTGLEGRDGTSG